MSEVVSQSSLELLEEIEELVDDLREEIETAGDIPTLELPSERLCKLAPRLAAVSEEVRAGLDGEDEGAELVEQPAVVEPQIGGNYYYFTHHKPTSNGKAFVMYGYRTDVTEAAEKMVERRIGDFLEYVRRVHGLDLRHPETVTEDDGKTYIYGVREITGYECLNELIAEWRGS